MCLLLTVILLTVVNSVNSANTACADVRYAYSTKGMNVYDLPLSPQSGKNLLILVNTC